LNCSGFGFKDDNRTPSELMEGSLLYKLYSHNQKSGNMANPNYFKEVHRSKFGKVRIFKILNVDMESKSWVADPRNKLCDVPGGWLCKGQYPPPVQNIIVGKKVSSSERKSPKLKEEMHAGHTEDKKDSFVPHINNKIVVGDVIMVKEVTPEAIEALRQNWKDTSYTALMWKVITQGTVEDLNSWLQLFPLLAHVRSSDGRGPMFWAFEYKKHKMAQVLAKYGVGHSDRDATGLTPVDLLDSQHVV
jgi:dolichyl-diphosphooligosaccharide--protein glycosyltransferase